MLKKKVFLCIKVFHTLTKQLCRRNSHTSSNFSLFISESIFKTLSNAPLWDQEWNSSLKLIDLYSRKKICCEIFLKTIYD